MHWSDSSTSGPSSLGRHDWWGAALMLAFTVAATWPLPVQLGTHLLSTGPDPDLYMWTLGWNAHAFLHQPWTLFDANIFFPHRHTLAYSENLIGATLPVAPWIWATGDLVTASNLAQLLSIFLSATGAYVLGRRLGLSVGAALVVGVIFGFAPSRLLRMPQVHVTSIQWIPWCLASLHAYFGPAGRARDLRLAVAFFSLQALTSGHGAAFLVVAVAVVLGYRLLTGEPIAFVRRVRDLGVVGFVALLPSVLLLLPYRAARAEVGGLTRLYEDVGVAFSSFFSSPSWLHRWLFERLPAHWISQPPEAHLFAGILPVALATVALVSLGAWSARRDAPGLARWRGNPVAVYAVVLFVSVWFVIGPPYGLWQWTYSWPVFSFMRVPTRFVLLEILALAVLAGFGVERLTRTRSPVAGRAIVAAVLVVLAIEFSAVPLETEPYAMRPPAADQWLASRPKPFSIAEVPVADSLNENTQAVWETRYMLHATAHWQPTVHGYSGVEPSDHHALIRALITFPDERSLDELRRRGVTYVVMHPRLYEPDQLAAAEARLLTFKDQLQLEFSSADGRVYALVPR
jgi:hypothetical protein